MATPEALAIKQIQLTEEHTAQIASVDERLARIEQAIVYDVELPDVEARGVLGVPDLLLESLKAIIERLDRIEATLAANPPAGAQTTAAESPARAKTK